LQLLGCILKYQITVGRWWVEHAKTAQKWCKISNTYLPSSFRLITISPMFLIRSYFLSL
jgi:hypothetical protein